jgi:hypothetical protein
MFRGQPIIRDEYLGTSPFGKSVSGSDVEVPHGKAKRPTMIEQDNAIRFGLSWMNKRSATLRKPHLNQVGFDTVG